MDELIGVLEYNDYYSRMDSVRFGKELVMNNFLFYKPHKMVDGTPVLHAFV